jgi:hypothetical protein
VLLGVALSNIIILCFDLLEVGFLVVFSILIFWMLVFAILVFWITVDILMKLLWVLLFWILVCVLAFRSLV